MDIHEARILLQRYLNDECTRHEKELVETWYSRLEETGDATWTPKEREFWGAEIEAKLMKVIGQQGEADINADINDDKDEKDRESSTAVSQNAGRRLKKMFRWAAAAAFAGVVVLALYWILSMSPDKGSVADQQPAQTDIQSPTGSHAVITLADGRKILLDSAGKGKLADQGVTQIDKTAEGEIVYSEGAGAGSPEQGYNTITVPRGSKLISLKLVDGTRVWLNSESSLKYPVSFASGERRVETSGEVYFEVAKDPARKFVVQSGETITRVLGTHFNVNSYKDGGEDLAITLFEGSVEVAEQDQTVRLVPGQQARVSLNRSVKIVDHADLEQVLAWKNGLFSFHDADIRSLMTQLGRFYGVDITFEGEIPAGKFSGEIGRELTFAQVLKILARTRVHYRVENGNHVIIYSKPPSIENL